MSQVKEDVELLEQLREALEQERAKVEQLQQEKLTWVMVTQEREQEIARQKAAELKRSFEEDKDVLIKSTRENVSKEFDQLLRVTKAEYKEELIAAEEKWRKEKSKIMTELKAELRKQIEEDLSTTYTNQRNKMTREMFEMNSQLNLKVDELAGLKLALKNKDALLQEKEKELREAVEKMSRSERKSSKHHMEEMESYYRQMQAKEKELDHLAEKLSRTQADKDQLFEEVKRLKEADTRGRRSTTPTPPSLSPSTSIEELTAVSKQISRRERDMVIRNSELSFRVRTLEDIVSKLKKENKDLESKLSECRSQIVPLKEHINKLNIRINTLSTTLRGREKKTNALSQEIVDLKSANQLLEEEHTKQRKSLQQQLSRTATLRNDLQKMSETNTRLLLKVDKLESENCELEQQLRNFMLTSPAPLSPQPTTPDNEDTLSISSESSSVQVLEDRISQMEFDKDETDIQLQEVNEKYEEMKTEYSSLRTKFKTLRTSYESAQRKLQEVQGSYKLELRRAEQLEKERLHMEGELERLQRVADTDSLYDQDRQEVTIESMQNKVDELQKEVDKMEQFITYQDAVWMKQEEVWTEEKDALVLLLEQLKTVSQDQINPENNSVLEEPNTKLTKELSEALEKLTFVQEENTQLSETLTKQTSEVASLNMSNTRLTEELSTRENKLTSLQESVSELTQVLREEQKRNAELNEDLERVKNSLKMREVDYATLLERLTQGKQQTPEQQPSQTEHQSLENSNAVLNGDLSSAEDEHALVQERIAQLKGELQDERNIKAVLNEDLRRARSSLQEREVEYSTIQEKLAKLEQQQKEIYGNTAPPALEQLSELDQQYRDKLKGKEEENAELRDSLSHATENISQLRALLEDLQRTLQAQSEEHLSQISEREEQIKQLTEQLSQSSSKLTRLKRGVPVGINLQMASELGHKVKSALKQLSDEIRLLPATSSKIGPHLRALEEAVNELLHTLFPGSFDAELTPVNSETNLHASIPNEYPNIQYDDLIRVTTPNHTPHTPTPHTYPHLSPLVEDEVDFPSSHNVAPTFPLKSRESLSGKAWRETPHLNHQGSYLSANLEKKKKGTLDSMQEARVFVAVMDYEPKSLCTTGRPDDEISFSTGAVLAVYGNMDAEGYYTAKFEGQIGRVPANFIQEVDVSDPVMKSRLFNQTLKSPLPSDTFMAPSRHTLLTTLTETSLVQSYGSTKLKTSLEAIGGPHPPTNFKVDKALGNSVLLVTWQPPRMDNNDGNYSNGCLVTGYQLYVNGETKVLISGATQTKTTLIELDLTQKLILGISTSSIDGKSSMVVSIQHLPVPRSISPYYHQQTLSSPSPEPEQYRTFIALYDYDPLKSSPCEHPEFELTLCEGDLIKVFGREMDDGFVVGELNGQRGLVPASFINEVKQSHPMSREMVSTVEEERSVSVRSQSISPSSPKLPKTATVMIASFDYNPERDSPNPNPEMELGFKKGEEITVFGKMDGDGYYSGQLGDKFGLVPSNFLALKKEPQSHPLSQSRDYTATSTNSDSRPQTREKGSTEESSQQPTGPNKNDPPTLQHDKKLTSRPPKSSSPKDNMYTRSPKIVKSSSSAKGKTKKTNSKSDTKKKRQGFRWQRQSKEAVS